MTEEELIGARGNLEAWGFEIYLCLFNKAMLAKQCWRLFFRLNSLAAKVLKECYYPQSSVLQAECGATSSFLWRSFVWGRELLEEGSRWRIGRGDSVYIYKDHWLPRPTTFKVITPLVFGELAKAVDSLTCTMRSLALFQLKVDIISVVLYCQSLALQGLVALNPDGNSYSV
ncbi:hypothetical protein Dsin_002208 [Dipteronia sinensis]|uniref:Reverse transcriptase n=1 Tax=Dipteronia sinensis TaxID=43782 RepID=A0AAE0B5P5_9ROSI|nr:hypothetical protein Dsin_002208 [Dipteronia sinensis]